jgi:transposase
LGKVIRRQYTPEFKREAVEMVIKENYTIVKAAKSQGISSGMLSRWKGEYLAGKGAAFPGTGHQTPEAGEIRRLKEENCKLRMEKEILKKAVAERFPRMLKSECQVNLKDMTVCEVRWSIAGYIEMFYNSERLHSYNGYLSPNEYEKRELVLV